MLIRQPGMTSATSPARLIHRAQDGLVLGRLRLPNPGGCRRGKIEGPPGEPKQEPDDDGNQIECHADVTRAARVLLAMDDEMRRASTPAFVRMLEERLGLPRHERRPGDCHRIPPGNDGIMPTSVN